MNEIARDERLDAHGSRAGSVWVGELRTSRCVALAIQGLLAFAAPLAGPAAAEPARQSTSSLVAQASIPDLKREYLRCDRVSSRQRLAPEAGAYCSTVGAELLKREFDGDLDLLLVWWREARHAAVPE